MIKKISFSLGLTFALLFAAPSFADSGCDLDRSNKFTYVEFVEKTTGGIQPLPTHSVKFDTNKCQLDYDGNVNVKFELWLYGAKLNAWTNRGPSDKDIKGSLGGGGLIPYSKNYNMRMFVDIDDSKKGTRWKQVHRMNRMKIKK